MTSDADRPRVIGLAPSQRTWRVLLADDNRDNLFLLKSLLEEVGFTVLEARDGREAVDVFRKESPDFIWMDMRMPLMDGYEATRTIRALPGGDQVPIVAITASAFREQRPDILAAGCDDVVYKPYPEHEIFELMGRMLDVEYLFAMEHQAAPGLLSRAELSARSADIPDALLRELDEAALALDREATLAVIAKIGDGAPHVAAGLEALVKNFQMAELRTLLATMRSRGDRG